ncbi:MAG: deoxyribonuclease V [Gammaproteobacteria bacterium]|nr:deoxyribonuclease V [Gammaproteobacteria bacterium]
MKTATPDLWPHTVQEAIAIQNTLRDKVITEDQLGEVRHVGGVDVGFEVAPGILPPATLVRPCTSKDNTVVRAAAVVLNFPGLELADSALARAPITFPYVPGLLSFRELPAVLEALKLLKITPDLILCDGQGIAHPRRIGIASHLGVLTDVPTIGVAKSLLIGTHEQLPSERGAWQPLRDRGEIIGAALRTRANVAPVYVSPGHRVSLPTAIHYVLACTTKYRLPETTRHAHRLASVLK